jgi:hypothetical protein
MLFTGLSRGMSNDLQRRATNVRAELIFMRPGAVQLTATTANLDTRYVEPIKVNPGRQGSIASDPPLLAGQRWNRIEQIDGVNWDAYASMNGISIGRRARTAEFERSGHRRNQGAQQQLSRWRCDEAIRHQEFRIAGIYAPESGARVKMSLEAMQKALEAEGKCTFIFLKLENPDQLQEVRSGSIASCRQHDSADARSVYEF